MEFDINTTFGFRCIFKNMLVSEKTDGRVWLEATFSFNVPGISRYYWAAACHGEEGIIRLVEQLNAELRLTMAQLGVAQVKDLTTRLDAGKVAGWVGGWVFCVRFVWFVDT